MKTIMRTVWRILMETSTILSRLNAIEQKLDELAKFDPSVNEALTRIEAELGRLSTMLEQLVGLVQLPEAVSGLITLTTERGTTMAKSRDASVDFTIFENGMAHAAITYFDANGTATDPPAGATYAWTPSDPSITLSPATDGLSTLITGGATALTAATVTQVATKPDSTAITTVSDPFDVIPNPPGAAVSGKIVLSA